MNKKAYAYDREVNIDWSLQPSRLVAMSVFIAISSIVGLVESNMLAGGIVPGVKFGLANIFTMLVLYYLGPLEALAVALGRVVVVSLLSGTLLQPSFIFSAAGALVSLVVLYLAYRYMYPGLTFIGISVLSAIGHNIAQLFVAALVINNMGLWSLLPWFIMSGTFFGTVNGILTNAVVRRVAKKTITLR